MHRRTNSVAAVAVSTWLLRIRRLYRKLTGRVPSPEVRGTTALLKQSLLFAFVILTCVFPSLCRCAPPSASSPSADDVRAAVLFHLTQFVEWPRKEQGEPYRICVAGSNTTAVELEHFIAGNPVRSHSISVQQIAGPMEARGCHIVFVAACTRPRLQQYLTSLRDSDVLTVGEQTGFVDLGGMIQLCFQADRVAVVVNLANIQRSHLTVSSKLLRLGHRSAERIAVAAH